MAVRSGDCLPGLGVGGVSDRLGDGMEVGGWLSDM